MEPTKKQKFVGAMLYLVIIIIVLIVIIYDKAHAEFTEEEYIYRSMYNLKPKLYDITGKSLFKNCKPINKINKDQAYICTSYDWSGEVCTTKIFNENNITTECKYINDMEDNEDER